ncbi:MAG: hypothetical protein ACRD6W_09100, partial [Nitrososphaerales archaeon]
PVWDRKDVATPFDSMAGFDDGIQLSITRQQVRDLPPADIDHPRRAGAVTKRSIQAWPAGLRTVKDSRTS